MTRSAIIFTALLAGCVTQPIVTPEKVSVPSGLPPLPMTAAAMQTRTLSVMRSYDAAVIANTPYSGRASVALAWDASPDSAVAGYRLYYGTESGSYSNSVMVGVATQATITGLLEGVTYYFACVAYDDAGAESDFSNEVSTTTGFYVSIRTANWSVETYGQAGATNQLLRSTNLIDWEVVKEFIGEAGVLTSVIEPNNLNAWYRVVAVP
jgi:hypothetical protein